MGELVPYDELLDSGRLDWLWDGRLHTMYGYTSHDLATFARVLARPCPDCGAGQAERCRTTSGRELMALDEQHLSRRLRR
jgi:hypothetical protein